MGLVIIGLLLAGITLFNLNRGVHYQEEIQSYNDKLRRLEKQLSKRKQTREKILRTLKGEEMQIIREGARRLNRIIIKDVFPWDRLLDGVELAVPDGMRLKEFKVAGDFSKVTLSGIAETPKSIAQLLKNLGKTDFVEKSLLTKLSVEKMKSESVVKTTDAGTSFEVECGLILEKLFGGKEYNKFSEDIKGVFVTK